MVNSIYSVIAFAYVHTAYVTHISVLILPNQIVHLIV